VCALAAIAPKGERMARVTIGIGMIPRGEVGLIFANIGLTLSIGGHAIVSPTLFSALVVMVIATTMITPPLLRWSIARSPRPPRQGT
jgi:Kef-type K+ transport system membrane component KefB